MSGAHIRTFLILCLLAIAPVLAGMNGAAVAQSPFGVATPSDSAQPGAADSTLRSAPSAFGRFQLWVQSTQRDLHRRLAGAVRSLKEGEGLPAAWLLASLSFFYGVVHAAGPGHGKAVISSYVLANEKTVRRGIALSFLASMAQAVSAVVLVAVLAVLLNAAGFRIKDAARTLEIASYALVAVVGVWLVWAAARRIWASRNGGHDHGHDHHHEHHHIPHHNHDHHHADGHSHEHGPGCGHAHMPDAGQVANVRDWKSAAAIILAVGLRPCTGAILVLVFAFANGLFLAGVGATFAMALGTAITVSVLAVLAITSREAAMRIAGPGSRWADAVFNVAALGGGLLVLALGVILFAGAMEPARPF